VWLAVLGEHTCFYELVRERGSHAHRMKPVNQKAWLLILPVVLCVAFSAILPLMTVVNYSVQDIISPERRVFVGTEWFKAVMRDDDLHGALLRQICFSLAVLAVEIPLGIALALADAGARAGRRRRCWCWWRSRC
jgi:ABC-type sugar transport system permease subunit